jgi:hypothetical protein
MKGMEKGGEGVSYVMCTYCREKKRSRTPASSHHLQSPPLTTSPRLSITSHPADAPTGGGAEIPSDSS